MPDCEQDAVAVGRADGVDVAVAIDVGERGSIAVCVVVSRAVAIHHAQPGRERRGDAVGVCVAQQDAGGDGDAQRDCVGVELACGIALDIANGVTLHFSVAHRIGVALLRGRVCY